MACARWWRHASLPRCRGRGSSPIHTGTGTTATTAAAAAATTAPFPSSSCASPTPNAAAATSGGSGAAGAQDCCTACASASQCLRSGGGGGGPRVYTPPERGARRCRLDGGGACARRRESGRTFSSRAAASGAAHGRRRVGSLRARSCHLCHEQRQIAAGGAGVGQFVARCRHAGRSLRHAVIAAQGGVGTVQELHLHGGIEVSHHAQRCQAHCNAARDALRAVG